MDWKYHIPRLCDYVASGGTVLNYCEANKFASSTLYRYLEHDSSAAAALARARETNAYAEVDEAKRIADDPTENPKRSALRINVRMQRAAKFLPKVFGERQIHEHTGQVDLVGIIGRVRQLQPMGNQAPMLEAHVIDAVELPALQGVDTQSIDVPDATPSIFD